jgi:serine O-acetyltransferase
MSCLFVASATTTTQTTQRIKNRKGVKYYYVRTKKKLTSMNSDEDDEDDHRKMIIRTRAIMNNKNISTGNDSNNSTTNDVDVSASFDQLPELTEDETATKWAGERKKVNGLYEKEPILTKKEQNKKEQRTRAEGETCLLGDGIWEKLCEEAKNEIILEPALASYLYSSILSHKNMADALAFVLANKLGSSVLLDSQLLELFSKCYRDDPALVQCAIADMQAVLERDPACDKYVQIILYFKGFQALQAQRIGHSLYLSGRKSLALLLQHRISEMFHVDAHPAAKIGKGVMIDHATGVVIGETAVIGDNVSILHNVTLGGTGTTDGDRHPKIGNGVVLGAGATVLGPVIVGANVKIGAGSVVLQDIPENSVAVGIPAKILRRSKSKDGKVVLEPSLLMDQTDFLEGWDFII